MPSVSSGLSIGSAIIGANGAKKAARTQAKSADAASQMQQQRFEQVREDLSPYRDAGSAASNRLEYLLGLSPLEGEERYKTDELVSGGGGTPMPNAKLYATDKAYKAAWDANLASHIQQLGKGYDSRTNAGNQLALALKRKLGYATDPLDTSDGQYGSLMKEFTGDDLENDPGYQFGLSEGNKALDRRFAAGGGYFSGAAIKAANRFGQDYAGTKFNEAFSRDNTTKSRAANFLSSVASMGANAAAQTGNASVATGNAIAGNMTGAANAQAAGTVGAANAWGNALGQIGNNYQQQQLLSSDNNMRYSGNPMANWGTSNGGIYGGSDSWG